MSLRYKDDWEATKQRYRAWWAHENTGRCGLWVTAPRDQAPGGDWPRRPDTPEERWMNMDYLAACNDHTHAHTFYGGEAFPVWSAGYPGHKSLSVFLGCPITLAFDTGWVDPIFPDDDIRWQDTAIDEDGPYYRFAMALQDRAIKESEGKSFPAICCALGGCGDTLSAMRGTERLLYDLMDRPDEVRAADLHFMDLWIEVYGKLYEKVVAARDGCTTWFSLWAPGKFYAAQNDFAYMISPRHFRDIFLPSLERHLAYLDYSVYHVDGIGNFAHVDMLCELPRLQALQILPGTGKPSPLHYMPVLKKVQAAGKNLHISIPPHQVETALEHLSARGLFIQTQCSSEAEARALLKNVETWSHDR